MSYFFLFLDPQHPTPLRSTNVRTTGLVTDALFSFCHFSRMSCILVAPGYFAIWMCNTVSHFLWNLELWKCWVKEIKYFKFCKKVFNVQESFFQSPRFLPNVRCKIILTTSPSGGMNWLFKIPFVSWGKHCLEELEKIQLMKQWYYSQYQC